MVPAEVLNLRIATFDRHPHQRHGSQVRPRPPRGPPRRAPRLPSPSLPSPSLPAPRLPARCHATIVSSHVVSARVKRAGPVSAATQPACLRDVLRLRDPARLLEPATLHLRRQCFAVGGPHAWRTISALPPVANPLSPLTRALMLRRIADSQTQLPRCAPGPRHNMAAPFAPQDPHPLAGE